MLAPLAIPAADCARPKSKAPDHSGSGSSRNPAQSQLRRPRVESLSEGRRRLEHCQPWRMAMEAMLEQPPPLFQIRFFTAMQLSDVGHLFATPWLPEGCIADP